MVTAAAREPSGESATTTAHTSGGGTPGGGRGPAPSDADGGTAGQVHGRHLRPLLGAVALSRLLPEPQGPLTVPAERGEQIAARREREGHGGLTVSPEGDRLSICGRPDSDPPAPLAGRHVADVAGQRDRVKKSTGRVHLRDIVDVGGHHGSE